MRTTRRGFIGGCIAMVAVKAIPCAGQIREPRYWLQTKKVVGGWCGLRNDGNLFFSIGDVSVPDLNLTNWHGPRGAYLSQRLFLNQFLESTCDCSLGHFCERHAYMDGGALHPKQHDPADRPDTQPTQAMRRDNPLTPPQRHWATVNEKTLCQEWTGLTLKHNKKSAELYLEYCCAANKTDPDRRRHAQALRDLLL